MSTTKEFLSPLDVICQHSRDGTVIPLKIRLQDEEGQFQSFRIRSFRRMAPKGAFAASGGVYVTNEIQIFECRILVFGKEREIRLYYDVGKGSWRILL